MVVVWQLRGNRVEGRRESKIIQLLKISVIKEKRDMIPWLEGMWNEGKEF